jgi:hypothetical protein
MSEIIETDAPDALCSRLLKMAEEEGRRRGCTRVTLKSRRPAST